MPFQTTKLLCLLLFLLILALASSINQGYISEASSSQLTGYHTSTRPLPICIQLSNIGVPLFLLGFITNPSRPSSIDKGLYVARWPHNDLSVRIRLIRVLSMLLASIFLPPLLHLPSPSYGYSVCSPPGCLTTGDWIRPGWLVYSENSTVPLSPIKVCCNHSCVSNNEVSAVSIKTSNLTRYRPISMPSRATWTTVKLFNTILKVFHTDAAYFASHPSPWSTKVLQEHSFL